MRKRAAGAAADRPADAVAPHEGAGRMRPGERAEGREAELLLPELRGVDQLPGFHRGDPPFLRAG